VTVDETKFHVPTVATAVPRVSVGLPVRNGGEMLRAALRSLLEQTETNLEIIVSDNASDDGTSEFLLQAARDDARIRYIRQQTTLSAYDNFQFVLKRARGKYFMWSAHDDTRDRDYVSRLAGRLDDDAAAVLAFGDLNIVTPDNPQGTETPFDFATTGLGLPMRLAKGARLQCFHIYGLWRTSAIQRVPYAHCAWWPDLPMMLAASVLGTFAYVPGPHFYYFEVPKTNLQRIKSQDYRTSFSLPRGVAELLKATYVACSQVGGPLVGIYCFFLVLLKHCVNLPGFLYRRLRRARAAHG
jgi:glycosyltransferase involved in cell wall biosynthesis